MIPAPFTYVRADDVGDAIAALVEHGDEAAVLAGGHSLLPLMRLRLAVPSVVVDVGRIASLRGIDRDGDELVIGATTTHATVVADPQVRAGCRVLADAVATIGDPQVRNRGTIGGAVAHGDAAGDLPAVLVALDATVVLAGPGGQRTVPATEFFRGYLDTARAADEVLVAVRVPVLGEDWHGAYEKFTRTAQSWALAGACVLVRTDAGRVREARVGLTNVAAVPVRSALAEAAIVAGGDPSSTDVVDADVEVVEDRDVDAAYRTNLARVLTGRAWVRATGARISG